MTMILVHMGETYRNYRSYYENYTHDKEILSAVKYVMQTFRGNTVSCVCYCRLNHTIGLACLKA